METFRTILLGLPTTLFVTTCSLAVGTVLAVPFMMGLRSKRLLIRLPCRIAVDLVRGIPPVVWLFILYYGVSVGTARPSSMTAGVIALGLVAAGYLAEIFRGSLTALNTGQWEAAGALGLGPATTWFSVIAPQAWRTALPAYTNYAIALLKDSSIVSMVGVAEVVNRTGELSRTSDLGIYVFVLAAAIYIVLSIPLGILSRKVDQRLHKAVAR